MFLFQSIQKLLSKCWSVSIDYDLCQFPTFCKFIPFFGYPIFIASRLPPPLSQKFCDLILVGKVYPIIIISNLIIFWNVLLLHWNRQKSLPYQFNVQKIGWNISENFLNTLPDLLTGGILQKSSEKWPKMIQIWQKWQFFGIKTF